MNESLELELCRATEAAAIAAYQWIGRGDKHAADAAAVDAMRKVLNQMTITGKVVIGEGEIDEAPMLYSGELVGTGKGPVVDIAVDPIDGTRMVAMGQAGALSSIAMGEAGAFLPAPDMYMEKLIVGKIPSGIIDLDRPLAENLKKLAESLGKPIANLEAIVLAKPRHTNLIKELQCLGIRVCAIPDGDVEGSLLTLLSETNADFLYGIGGAPEGVISAAMVQALGGDMQARLILRSIVHGLNEKSQLSEKEEILRCKAAELPIGEKLSLNQLVKSKHILVSATGITSGTLLKGISKKNGIVSAETLTISGGSRGIRKIQSCYRAAPE